MLSSFSASHVAASFESASPGRPRLQRVRRTAEEILHEETGNRMGVDAARASSTTPTARPRMRRSVTTILAESSSSGRRPPSQPLLQADLSATTAALWAKSSVRRFGRRSRDGETAATMRWASPTPEMMLVPPVTKEAAQITSPNRRRAGRRRSVTFGLFASNEQQQRTRQTLSPPPPLSLHEQPRRSLLVEESRSSRPESGRTQPPTLPSQLSAAESWNHTLAAIVQRSSPAAESWNATLAAIATRHHGLLISKIPAPSPEGYM